MPKNDKNVKLKEKEIDKKTKEEELLKIPDQQEVNRSKAQNKD